MSESALTAEASYEAGNARFHAGDFSAAAAAYGAAIRRRPGFAEAHYNLGISLDTLGDRGGAERCFQTVLAIQPHSVPARLNLAKLCHDRGEQARAIRLFREALAHDPQRAEALGNLGLPFARAEGNSASNLAWLERALSVAPTDVAALANLGALHAADAVGQRCLRRAQSLAPAMAQLALNHGNRLRARGQSPAAGTAYKRALWLGAGAPALVNLGLLAVDRGAGEEASRNYRRSLALDPVLPGAHRAEAELSHRRGGIGRAWTSAKRALALAADDAAAHNALANALLALGEAEFATAQFRHAVEVDLQDQKFHSNLLFSLCYLSDQNPAELLVEARRWGALHASQLAANDSLHANTPEPDRTLRIGYLSADFRDHPVANNVLGLIEHHDRSRVAVYCYADLRSGGDATTDRLRGLDVAWREVTGEADADVAAHIQADAIDVLVVLAGHAGHNRPAVAAHRPAPVQVSLHDVTTSGLASMDAWLTDGVLHPAETSERFTEELVRLPCFYLHRAPERMAIRPPPHRDRGFITFGSCNNPAKIGDRVIQAWAAILAAVPGSRLLLKYKDWFGDEAVRARFTQRFGRHGIDPGRLAFLSGDLPRSRQLAVLNEVDIALDPFPFNGSTATFEALWMGVPVVSLAGTRFVGRVGLSVLTQIGLVDLVAESDAEYGRIAVGLAGDHDRLKRLRETLRDRLLASSLLDAPAHARSVEAAYRALWRRWCARSRP